MRRATISNTFTVNTVEDGESPIFADLDNEMFGVACDADGRSSAVVDKTINVSMWYGLTRLTLSEITYAAPEGVSVTATAGVGTVRIVIPQGTLLQETNTVSLTLRASYDGIEYTRNLSVTISAVRGGSDAEIFEWMPNVGNVLKKDDGTYSISSVICTVQRIKGDSVSNVTNPSLYGLTAVYSIDGGSEQAYTIGSGIATSAFTRSVRFSLYKGNTLVDRETILMVYDGSSGYVLDLDNENDSILYDGNTIIGSKPQTTWTLYKGGVDISDSVIKNANTIHITAEGCTANFVSGSVYRTVQVDAMTAETGKVTISVTHGGNTYSAVMSIKKLVGVDKYEIVVAPNAITYNETDQSKSSSTWINIKVYRTSGATGNRMFVSRLADESLTLFISPILPNGDSAGHTRIADGSSQGSYTSNDGASRSLSTNYPQFKVDLFRGGTETYGTGVSQDSETIPVIKVEDGKGGRGIVSIAIAYALSNVGTVASDEQAPSFIYGSWSAVPPEPTEQYRYLWRREITTYTIGSAITKYYLQSMRGTDGASALTIDIDNEMISVALDRDGYVIKPIDATSNYYSVRFNVKMYLGTTAQTLSRNPSIITPSTLPDGIRQGAIGGGGTTTGYVTLNIYYGDGTSQYNHKKPFGTNSSIIFTIQAECEAGTLFVPFTLIGNTNGETYELIPSASAIVKKKDDTAYTPAELRCDFYKYVNGERLQNPNDVTLYYTPDNNTLSRTEYTPVMQAIENYGNPTKSITFEAVINNVVVDRETIPIVVDGEDGTPAPEKSETKYAWSTSDRTTSPTTEPVLDSGTTWLTYITNRPSTGTYYLWQRIERWTWNASTKQYVSQGKMYFRMSGEDAKATQIKGLVRKVWAHSNVYDWPPDPKNGDKVLILNNPSLYVYNGTSWSMSITASVGDAYVFSEDSHVYVCISTTASLCWQDVGTIKGADGASSYIHIAWANSGAPDYEDFTTSKNPEDVYKYIGVCSGTGEETDPEDPTLYTWSEIKGYDASTWIVMLNSATVKVSASGIMTGNIAGSFYKETNGQRELVTNYSTGSSVYVVIEAINANGVQKTWRYSATYGTFSTGGWGSQWLNNKSWSTYGNCQELRVSCEVGGEIKASLHLPVIQDGQQGERGKTGRNYYFRGTWEDFIEEEEPTFQVTDSEAPFFSRTRTEENKEVTRYWVFTGDNGTYTPQSSVCPPSDNGSWTLMVTDFKFLIGEAIFYDFAKLGSAIFNKDWMFSQYGYTGDARGNDYPAFSPQFPNKDLQTLDLDTTIITSTAQALSERDRICPLVMKANVRYSFSIEATGYDSGHRLYIAMMNPDGDEVTFEGGSTLLQFSTHTTITGYVTPTKSGTHYWVGAVSNANYAGSVQAILMQCNAPFIPTVAVDWLRGYAHFSNDKVRFNEEGDGYVAGGNISWDSQGNASFAGNVDAESGNIGDFVLDNGDLRVGANAIWDEDTQSGNYTLLSKGRMRMRSILTDVVSIKLAMGNNANQGDSRALAISRIRMDSVDDYIPAVELTTNTYTSTLDSRHNQIALRTTGLNVAKNGIASFGHIYVFNSSSYTLDLSKGCEWLLVPNSTSQRTLYLPTPYDINSLLYGESDAQFALKIMLVSHYSSGMGNILVRFQDSSALGFINHDGSVWHSATEGVTLTRGRMLELLLVYYAGSYYAQRLSDTL